MVKAHATVTATDARSSPGNPGSLGKEAEGFLGFLEAFFFFDFNGPPRLNNRGAGTTKTSSLHSRGRLLTVVVNCNVTTTIENNPQMEATAPFVLDNFTAQNALVRANFRNPFTAARDTNWNHDLFTSARVFNF